MIVKELIEKLLDMPQDKNIKVFDKANDCEIHIVDVVEEGGGAWIDINE